MTYAIKVADLDDLATRTTLQPVTKFDTDDRLNDVPNNNQLLVQNNHAQLAALTPNRVVMLEEDSVITASFVIEAEHDDRIPSASLGAAGETTKLTGRPLVSILDRAAVKPTLGYDRKPFADTRVFSFASPEYTPDGAWIVPTVIVASVATDSTHYTGLPDGFWCPAEPWIGPSSGDDTQAPFGYWYTIYDFTLAADALVIFGMAVDDRALVFIDGFQLSNIDPNTDPTSGYRSTHMEAIFLSAGPHRFAVKVINNFGSGDPGFGEGATVLGNPTAFVMTAWQADAGGKLVQRLFGTADYADWLILEYPNTAPGMTIGQIARVLIAEAQADGLIPDVTTDFGDTDDTAANAWDQLEAVTVNVGDSLLAILKNWSLSYCDFAMAYDEQRLSMWRYRERGTTPGVSYSLANKNLASEAFDSVDVGTDCLIVTWNDGVFRHPTSGGTRLGFLRTRAATKAEAEAIAVEVVALQQAQVEQVTLAIIPTGTADRPGDGVLMGDTVAVPGRPSGTANERVVEIRKTLTDRGIESAIAVRDVLLSDQDRTQLVIQRMTSGSLGGTAPAQPAGLQPKFGTKINVNEVTFSLLDPPVTGESPDKIPAASANLYALAVTAKVAGSTDTTFEFLVDGVDVVAGFGILPAGETFVLIPMVDTGIYVVHWVEGNKTRMAVNVTAVGTDATGLLFEPRFV